MYDISGEAYNQVMTTSGLPRDDLAAALQARRELGPDYDAAFAEALAERVDETIQARLAAQNGRRPGPAALGPDAARLRDYEQANAAGERHVGVAIALVSLGVSIPLSGIAAAMHSLVALMIVWIGIVMVNLANAVRCRI
jgi:hypothetical protein